MSAPHERYREYLENLRPGTLSQLPEYVADNVRFADPFNDVIGVQAMTRVFQHMFENLGDVTFSVSEISFDGTVCLMTWRFSATLRSKPWSFDGVSVVRFNGRGLVVEHIDHWDASRNFYERLPIIGWLLAKIRRRLSI